MYCWQKNQKQKQARQKFRYCAQTNNSSTEKYNMSLQTARYKILLDAWIRRYQENSKNQRFLLVQFTYWKVFAFPNLKMRVSLEKSYQKTLYHSHFKYLLIALFSSVWYVNTFLMQKTYFIEQKIFYYICIFYIFIYNIYTYIYIYIYMYIYI